MIKVTGAQIIIKILENKGIKNVFGIPGGMILPLYDELARSKIKHILVRQEQAGGFMAQGVARTTGKAAVCFATSGPGVMNLLTAIADARSDSVPLVAITGQVDCAAIGTDAFQETDTFGLSMPICKHSVMVKSAKELLEVLPKAFYIAESGRPGPVMIDVPRDVQEEVCEVENWDFLQNLKTEYQNESCLNPENKCELPLLVRTPYANKPQNLESLCAVAADLFAKSSSAVLFCGGGAVCSKGASEIIQKLSKEFNIPVCTSLMGLTVEPFDAPFFCGMVGMHGSYAANRVMYESDLIIAVGVRFDDRATGLTEKFCPNAKIIHIDIDAAEINKIYQSSVAIPCDAARALNVLFKKFAAPECAKASERNKNFWKKHLPVYQKSMEKIYPKDKNHPAQFLPRIESIYRELNEEKCPFVTTDVGQHQLFVAQCFPFRFARQFLTSGSLGTMGFGLPAAIGAALENKGCRVLCFSGDGSILMNIQELATLAELNLDVTVFVLDNNCLGMVRQQQELLYNENYSGVLYAKKTNLSDIARGFGIDSYKIENFDDFDEIIKKSLIGTGPRFVQIPIEKYNVFPFVPNGKPNIEPIGVDAYV
ncbi:MAG: biosynthetic-type acetolactate synthase large subunit [Treponemataceae bacterium]|nr:biosynthetic-type acetolactate synthase large subunit [Treponemataceae bacterium]